MDNIGGRTLAVKVKWQPVPVWNFEGISAMILCLVSCVLLFYIPFDSVNLPYI
jgi:hypothetical protein